MHEDPLNLLVDHCLPGYSAT